MATSASGIQAAQAAAFIGVQFTYSTKIGIADEDVGGGLLGFMDYSEGTSNWCRTLNFYKPKNMRVQNAVLHIIYRDYLATDASERNVDVTTYLNPAKTKVEAPFSEYFRYSGGTTIRSLYDPTVDEDTTEDVFTVAQIGEISDGWNRIVSQCETNDAGENARGYLTMTLILTGYITGVPVED